MIARDIVLQPEQSIDLEPDATTLYDLSRYKTNGVITNAIWVQLPSGLWVLSYDGTLDYVTFIGVQYNFPIDVTIEVWFNSSIFSAAYRGLVENRAGLQGCALHISNANKLAFFYRGNNHFLASTRTFTAADQDVWFHGVATRGNVDNKQRIYINGVIDKTGVATVDDTAYSSSIRLGRTTAGESLIGYTGLIRVYNYALTAGQILNNYNSEKYLYGIND